MKKLLIALMTFGSLSVQAQTACEQMIDLLKNASRTVGKLEMKLEVELEKDSKYVETYEGLIELAKEKEARDESFLIRRCLK